MSVAFVPGEAWRYVAPRGFEESRIIVGAVLTFPSGEDVVCCAVTDAPRRHADGRVDRTTIPFIPFTASALAATVVERVGAVELPETFAAGLAQWQGDDRGLSVFTVPFEGYLDRLIARQMAAILGVEEEEAPALKAAS
jgi:hypothetical protein